MSLDPNSEYNREQRERKKIKYIPIGSTDDKPKEGNTELKPTSKHYSGTGQQIGKFYISPLSTRKRKKRFGDLQEEDLDILRSQFGSSGDGVSLVSSRESTYDGGGWH